MIGQLQQIKSQKYIYQKKTKITKIQLPYWRLKIIIWSTDKTANFIEKPFSNCFAKVNWTSDGFIPEILSKKLFYWLLCKSKS